MNNTIQSTWIDSSIQELDGSDEKFHTQAIWRASIDTDESTTNYISTGQAGGDANNAQDYNSITDSSKGWQSFIGAQVRALGKTTAANFGSPKSLQLRQSIGHTSEETEIIFPPNNRKTALDKTDIGKS